jgi:hypothetical protein
MSGNHTPGPWAVKGTRIRDCNPGIDCIATMQVSNQPNWDADARLIAAAPEMLDALVMIRDADEDCRRDGLPTIPFGPRAKIDAAIAKATCGPTKEQA